jgi:hypothetical protein
MEDNIKFIPDEELVPIHVMQSFSQVVDWGLMQSSIPEAWKYTMGEGINVAILDTGIAEHPDMEGALLPPLNFSGENDHIDRNGHGCIAPTDKIFIDGEGVMSIENLYKKTPADLLYINYKDEIIDGKQIDNHNIPQYLFITDAAGRLIDDIIGFVGLERTKIHKVGGNPPEPPTNESSTKMETKSSAKGVVGGTPMGS